MPVPIGESPGMNGGAKRSTDWSAGWFSYNQRRLAFRASLSLIATVTELSMLPRQFDVSSTSKSAAVSLVNVVDWFSLWLLYKVIRRPANEVSRSGGWITSV